MLGILIFKMDSFQCADTVDGSEIRLTSWGTGSFSNYLQGFIYIPGGDPSLQLHDWPFAGAFASDIFTEVGLSPTLGRDLFMRCEDAQQPFFLDQWLFGHTFSSSTTSSKFLSQKIFQTQWASNTLLNLSASFKVSLILLGFPWIGRCIHRQPLRIVWPYRACGRGLVALPQVKARSNNNQHLYRFFNDQIQKTVSVTPPLER